MAMAERSNVVLVVVMRRWKGIGWFLGQEGTPGTDSYFPVSIESNLRLGDSQQPGPPSSPCPPPPSASGAPSKIHQTPSHRFRSSTPLSVGTVSIQPGRAVIALRKGRSMVQRGREGSYRGVGGGTAAFVCKGISIDESQARRRRLTMWSGRGALAIRHRPAHSTDLSR